MYNQVILIGRLYKFPETRLEVRGGRKYLRARLVTKRAWTTLEGEAREEPTWHTIEAWGRSAELLDETPGNEEVFLMGWYKTWTDDATGKFHAAAVAQLVLRLGRKSGLSAGAAHDLTATVLAMPEAEVKVVRQALAQRAAEAQRAAPPPGLN